MKATLLALALLASTQAAASFNCVQVQYSPNRVETRFDQVSWTVASANPPQAMPGPVMDSWTVEFACAANGPELDYIRSKFSGIPMRGTGGRTIVWEGDFARFILDNL